ncbi:hypothetical protein ACFPM0_23130 [Pseudonocardia sulfidoxydans]|uniref:hypothetical protein n=1 Tax=Pseudonocardia sulfidoxydans TaxID=54011 RepID=UPI003618124B
MKTRRNSLSGRARPLHLGVLLVDDRRRAPTRQDSAGRHARERDAGAVAGTAEPHLLRGRRGAHRLTRYVTA